MTRLIVLLLLIYSVGSSCTVCATYSAKTSVQISIDSTKETIKTAKITWKVNKEFTDSLKEVYDTNVDGTIDKRELIFLEEAFLAYAEQNNFLIHISYDKVIDRDKSNKIELLNA